MAALKIFARPCFSHIFSTTFAINTTKNKIFDNFKVQQRYSSFKSTSQLGDSSNYTDFEVSKNPKEWMFVERIIPPKIVPLPPSTDKPLPSGWKPQSEEAKKFPYFVDRTKNHMQPVYLRLTFRGMRKVTNLRRIQGDIWTLETELKKYIEEKCGKRIGSQVHEVAGQINFRGDHVASVKEWLDSKGF